MEMQATKLCNFGMDMTVCSVGWSQQGTSLEIGTRNGEVQLFVWNRHSTQPVLKYSEHKASMKAIAWSPHHYGLLASGGDATDCCIRFWNTNTGSHLSCMDTGSQACNLVWSKNRNEVVSTHGDSQFLKTKS